ncbi:MULTISPECIES: sugar transporter [unclassified Caballeronia]|uniref:sugar transporter n=1 Tax=unclassified Caballeronia TaxID=2646786 RepID=UPI002540C550|nr:MULTISPECIES: sugar transporter [unclassified Caballeronia]MDR5799971.1 sugar transporter [Caballeronia sp. LZ001]
MLTHHLSFFKRPWWGVMALTFAAFIFNTTEFVPVGLLTAIGNSLDMRPTDVGVVMTIYAWTVSVASLPLTLFVREVERRTLLMRVFIVFILSHIVTGLAPNFEIFVLGRIGIAFAHAVFWSISIPLVVRLVPPDGERRALAMISIGTSVAMVAGVPIGRAIGDTFGWRATFQIIAGAAVLGMGALWLTLPKLDSQGSGSLNSLPKLLKTPVLVALFAVTVLTVCAHFTSYTYLEPFARAVTGASNIEVTFLLVLFGAAGVPAAVCFSRFYANRPRRFLLWTLCALAACLLLLWPCGQYVGTLSMLLLFWGVAIICFGLAMQAHVLRLAPDAADIAISMFSALYNIGIGAGALVGKFVARDVGLAWIGMFGAAVAVLGAVVCWLAFMAARRGTRRAAPLLTH